MQCRASLRSLRHPGLLAAGLAVALAAGQVFAQSSAPPESGAQPSRETAESRGATNLAQPLEYPALEGTVDPGHYVVGPGDELELAIYGRATARAVVIVDAEGSIYVPSVGHVKLGGLTLGAAQIHLNARFERGYRGVKADLSLLRPRRIRVHVSGEVLRPGGVEVQAPARVADVIRQAGGFTRTASHRNIVVSRTDGGRRSADLEKYSLLGSLADNPFVDNGDVVEVPPALMDVEVSGEVSRPGHIEFRDEDRVSDAVALAGGLRAAADSDSVELWRFSSADQGFPIRLPLRAALLAPGGPADLGLRGGDRLFVRNTPSWHRRSTVYVVGEVMRPGSYAIPSGGEMASTVLARVGGLTPFADVKSATVYRPSLQPTRDTAYVNALRSGLHEISHEDAEFLKMHALAQGNLSNQVRNLLYSHDPSADFRLLDGDLVLVPGRTRSVAVYGAVRRPGVVAYVEGDRWEDYVSRAGGFGDRADRAKARVTRVSTGQPVSASDVSEIGEGDIIWVPEREPRDFLKTVSGVMGFLAQFATVYLVIHQATAK